MTKFTEIDHSGAGLGRDDEWIVGGGEGSFVEFHVSWLSDVYGSKFAEDASYY